MRELIFLFFLLSLLWLVASGIYKPLLLCLGLGSVLLVLWIVTRMKIVGEEHNPLVFSWRLPVFWLWALKEIVIANLHVARLVFSPERISPRIVHMNVDFIRPLGKVVFGNTCTLTPGTVTVRLTKTSIVAHALDGKSAAALVDGTLKEKVDWLEGKSSHPARSST